MSLIIEDGTTPAGAESYAAVSDADTYHGNRGNTGWVGTIAQKEQALRSAVDYLQQMYRGRWKGYRTKTTQSLDWPRQSVLYEDSVLNAWVPNNSIPQELKNAQMELALRIITGTVLAPDLTRKIDHVRVGDVDVTYDHSSPQYTVFRVIDGWLRPFLTYSGVGMSLIRS